MNIVDVCNDIWKFNQINECFVFLNSQSRRIIVWLGFIRNVKIYFESIIDLILLEFELFTIETYWFRCYFLWLVNYLVFILSHFEPVSLVLQSIKLFCYLISLLTKPNSDLGKLFNFMSGQLGVFGHVESGIGQSFRYFFLIYEDWAVDALLLFRVVVTLLPQKSVLLLFLLDFRFKYWNGRVWNVPDNFICVFLRLYGRE